MHNLNTHPDFQSHTQPNPPFPFMANMPHRLTHSPIFAKMHNPTTHREFYCRVRYMYPTESNPHLLECLAAKLLTQPIDVPIPLYWIPNRTPLRYQIPLPILLFYYVQIDLASNANTPPPPSSTVWYLVNLGPCEPQPCSCTLAKEEQKYIPCQPDR